LVTLDQQAGAQAGLKIKFPLSESDMMGNFNLSANALKLRIIELYNN
jgi:hypothetical protein